MLIATAAACPLISVYGRVISTALSSCRIAWHKTDRRQRLFQRSGLRTDLYLPEKTQGVSSFAVGARYDIAPQNFSMLRSQVCSAPERPVRLSSPMFMAIDLQVRSYGRELNLGLRK